VGTLSSAAKGQQRRRWPRAAWAAVLGHCWACADCGLLAAGRWLLGLAFARCWRLLARRSFFACLVSRPDAAFPWAPSVRRAPPHRAVPCTASTASTGSVQTPAPPSQPSPLLQPSRPPSPRQLPLLALHPTRLPVASTRVRRPPSPILRPSVLRSAGGVYPRSQTLLSSHAAAQCPSTARLPSLLTPSPITDASCPGLKYTPYPRCPVSHSLPPSSPTMPASAAAAAAERFPSLAHGAFVATALKILLFPA